MTVQNVAGEAPNGTGFAITTGPAPALDKTNLVVGRVVEGMDVVAALQKLPFAKWVSGARVPGRGGLGGEGEPGGQLTVEEG